MANMEVVEIPADEREEVEEVSTSKGSKGKRKSEKKTRDRKSKKYAKEWIKILLGSSNKISTNDHDFKDPCFLCREANFPNTNGYDLFMFFYCNKIMNAPI